MFILAKLTRQVAAPCVGWLHCSRPCAERQVLKKSKVASHVAPVLSLHVLLSCCCGATIQGLQCLVSALPCIFFVDRNTRVALFCRGRLRNKSFLDSTLHHSCESSSVVPVTTASTGSNWRLPTRTQTRCRLPRPWSSSYERESKSSENYRSTVVQYRTSCVVNAYCKLPVCGKIRMVNRVDRATRVIMTLLTTGTLCLCIPV